MPVYFVQAGENGPIKIGFAQDVFARMVKMQADCPYPLTVLANIADGDVAAERRMHERFSADRLRGEWFNPSSELLALIASLPMPTRMPRKQYGEGRADLCPALRRAVIASGGPIPVGEALGLSREAVTQWKRCPAKYAIPLEAMSERQITRHELRPDLYPVDELGNAA